MTGPLGWYLAIDDKLRLVAPSRGSFLARIQALVPHDGRQKDLWPWYWMQGSARECVFLNIEGEREPMAKWEHGDTYLLTPWMLSEKWLFLGGGMCIIVIVRRAFGQTEKPK